MKNYSYFINYYYYSLISKLPSEELGTAVKHAIDKLNVTDTTSSVRDLLAAYSAEVPSEVSF